MTAQTTALIAGAFGLMGVVLGAFLMELREFLTRRERHLSYWSALSAEVDLCHGYAKAYYDGAVSSPLYRLPTIAYDNGFPALLGDGVITEKEAHCILRFYAQATQINRGLKYAHTAPAGSPALDQEESRLRLKAKNLIDPNCTDPGGPYYSAVRETINKHVRWRKE